MTPSTPHAHPKIVSRAEWLAARKDLLAREKAATSERDAINAQRRRLPMVKLDRAYVFQGPEGEVTLLDLFRGRSQLYVHHFMWNDETKRHCPGCTAAADVGFTPKILKRLEEKDLSFVAISRAPLDQITPYKTAHGWEFPWYSGAGTSFNHDFHITLDESVASLEYNYRNKSELLAAGETEDSLSGDRTGASVFLRRGDEIFHTYSTYARGMEPTFPPAHFFDVAPYGRQEAWEDSPAGWPQKPTYG